MIKSNRVEEIKLDLKKIAQEKIDKPKISVDAIRKWIEAYSHKEIVENDEINKDRKITVGIAKEDDQMRIDCTVNKRKGVLRALYSLHSTTGLASIPLKKEEIMDFDFQDATIFNALKMVNFPNPEKKIEEAIEEGKKRPRPKEAKIENITLPNEVLNSLELLRQSQIPPYLYKPLRELVERELEFEEAKKEIKIFLPEWELTKEHYDWMVSEVKKKKGVSWIKKGTFRIQKKPGGKEFFKNIKPILGKTCYFEINDHYTYGITKKIKFMGKKFARRHWDLRLEQLNGDLTLFYYLGSLKEDATEKEKETAVREIPREKLFPKRSLVSFSIPKSKFPKRRGERLLCSRTADHPMDYSTKAKIGEIWEIPETYFGGGLQEMEDKGEYLPLDVTSERFIFWLDGQKVKGAFALIGIGKPRKSDFLLVRLKEQNLGKLKEQYLGNRE